MLAVHAESRSNQSTKLSSAQLSRGKGSNDKLREYATSNEPHAAIQCIQHGALSLRILGDTLLSSTNLKEREKIPFECPCIRQRWVLIAHELQRVGFLASCDIRDEEGTERLANAIRTMKPSSPNLR